MYILFDLSLLTIKYCGNRFFVLPLPAKHNEVRLAFPSGKRVCTPKSLSRLMAVKTTLNKSDSLRPNRSIANLHEGRGESRKAFSPFFSQCYKLCAGTPGGLPPTMRRRIGVGAGCHFRLVPAHRVRAFVGCPGCFRFVRLATRRLPSRRPKKKDRGQPMADMYNPKHPKNYGKRKHASRSRPW